MGRMVVIIDAGLGNVGSVENMFRHVGVRARVATEPDHIKGARALVLPGVGAFDRGIELLDHCGFRPALDSWAAADRPLLGICLGFQMMTRGSDEGRQPGFGWLAGKTRRFDLDPRIHPGCRIPHMGWGVLRPEKNDPLLPAGECRFYFVHSYHVETDDPAAVVATSEHGIRFVAMARRGNLVGVQFHPEKSHRFGMDLLRRFAASAGCA